VGSHYYDRSGKPRYQVQAKNGKGLRDTTLADARPNGWVPSVTTICDVAAKWGLVNWQIEQAILATLTLPKDALWSDKEYIQRIRRDAQAQGSAAAAEGTRIHDAIEKHYKGEKYDARYRPHVGGVVAALEKAFPEVGDWIAEQSFAHPVGFGGRVDLHSPSARVVVDHKGKDFGPLDDTRMAHDQYIQLAGCAEGLFPDWTQEPAGQPALVSCFVSRSHPGEVRLHIWGHEYLSRGWNAFRGLLIAWKALNNYECGWQS
jgi:hypothetical protein